METNDVSNHFTYDDKPNDDLFEITSHVKAHAILSDYSFDSHSVIENLQFQSIFKVRFFIPLCRLLSMFLVRPTLLSYVLKLEEGFIHGCRSGSVVFHISVVNNEIETEDVISELMNSWNVHWKMEVQNLMSFLKKTMFSTNLWTRCFGFGMRIIVCKHGGPLFISIIREKQLGTFPWMLFC